MSKVLVLYVFHQYNDRVDKFIKHAIFKDENIDFMIICNSQNTSFSAPDYVKVIVRNNIGYDFGGWSHALLDNDVYVNYDKFIFVNSSVSGPYLRDKSVKWTDVYINGLQNNVKLFGSTINVYPDVYQHVQSYIFSMDKETLQYLIDCKIFSTTEYSLTFGDAIHDKEIGMSKHVLKNGWNIGSLLKLYEGVDFTKEEPPKKYGDIMFFNQRGKLWDEHDLVFIKGNRMGM